MKVLVTGAAGFLRLLFMQYLHKKGYLVKALDSFIHSWLVNRLYSVSLIARPTITLQQILLM